MMPLYGYRCSVCGRSFSEWRPMAESGEPASCLCGANATRTISAPRILSDLPGYSCPVSGSWVEGRAAHEENLRKTGCRILEAGEREDLTRSKQAAEDAFDREIEATVEKEFDAMPSEKREKLGAELLAGVDCAVERL